MVHIIIGALLIMIVLGAAWLLVVYNRITNLASLAREHQLSAEKKCHIRRRLLMMTDLSGKDTETIKERIDNIEHQIEIELQQQRKVLKDRQKFCSAFWVKPAIYMMGMEASTSQCVEEERT